MKRSAFIIVTFLFIALAAKGQSIEEIQTSKDYIWGTGNAATLKKADNEALAALISQISTNVSSDRKSTRLNSSHNVISRMPSSA